MISDDIPEFKETHTFVINVNNEEERMKQFYELLDKINEKHIENIPDPFTENILVLPFSYDSASSMQINVVDTKIDPQSLLGNEIQNVNNNKQYNFVFNSDPELINYDFNSLDFKNIYYYHLCDITQEDKKISYYFAPEIPKK